MKKVVRRRVLWVLVGFSLLAILVMAWAPFFVLAYVERNYPGVHAGSVALRPGYVRFGSFTVSRPGVEASLDSVVVDWDRNVSIIGGSIKVDVEALRNEGGSASSGPKSLRGEGLAIEARGKDVKATLTRAEFKDRRVCFAKGSIAYEKYTAEVLDGCFDRQKKSLEAKEVEVPVSLPFDVPRMARSYIAKAYGVLIETDPLKRVAFEKAELGDIVKTKRPSSVMLTKEGVILSASDLEINHPWLDPDPVTFRNVRITLPSEGSSLKISLNSARISLDPSHFEADGSEPCNTWVDALPEPLPKALEEAKGHFEGDLSFTVRLENGPALKVTNNCNFTCSADPIAKLKRALQGGPLTEYLAYDKDNRLFTRPIGLNTKDWVPLVSLPPHIPKAIVTMEDPGFPNHRGILVQALENSLKQNLELGRFFRGGSTISMQLAKNLWLKRHKTIGRKAQEALLTVALESCLSKAEILELYLNVVEFGPNLYGIGPAAKHYFEKDARKLEAEEAFYLASILPRPRKAIPPKHGGMNRIRNLMATLAFRGFISEALIPVNEDEVDPTGWETE